MTVIILVGFSCDFTHWSMCTRLTFLVDNQLTDSVFYLVLTVQFVPLRCFLST